MLTSSRHAMPDAAFLFLLTLSPMLMINFYHYVTQKKKWQAGAVAVLNCRFISYILRATTAALDFSESYIQKAPFPTTMPKHLNLHSQI